MGVGIIMPALLEMIEKTSAAADAQQPQEQQRAHALPNAASSERVNEMNDEIDRNHVGQNGHGGIVSKKRNGKGLRGPGRPSKKKKQVKLNIPIEKRSKQLNSGSGEREGDGITGEANGNTSTHSSEGRGRGRGEEENSEHEDSYEHCALVEQTRNKEETRDRRLPDVTTSKFSPVPNGEFRENYKNGDGSSARSPAHYLNHDKSSGVRATAAARGSPVYGKINQNGHPSIVDYGGHIDVTHNVASTRGEEYELKVDSTNGNKENYRAGTKLFLSPKDNEKKMIGCIDSNCNIITSEAIALEKYSESPKMKYDSDHRNGIVYHGENGDITKDEKKVVEGNANENGDAPPAKMLDNRKTVNVLVNTTFSTLISDIRSANEKFTAAVREHMEMRRITESPYARFTE